MDPGQRFIDYPGPLLVKVIDRPGNQFLIPRDRGSGNDYRIPGHNRDPAVFTHGHPAQGRQRFTLAPGGHQHHFIGRQTLNFIQSICEGHRGSLNSPVLWRSKPHSPYSGQ